MCIYAEFYEDQTLTFDVCIWIMHTGIQHIIFICPTHMSIYLKSVINMTKSQPGYDLYMHIYAACRLHVQHT